MTMLLAAVIVAVMVWALIKKYETRMVLIAGGLALACLAADPLEPLKAFSASMKQSKIFEVIISCMGFAAVIKLTGCHTHLIAIFVKLLKKAGPFVIIGAALATMVVNSAIPSAAGTSAAVGTALNCSKSPCSYRGCYDHGRSLRRQFESRTCTSYYCR